MAIIRLPFPRPANLDEVARDFSEIDGISLGGGGKRFATVVVAASNSLSHAASDADFVCTGTADDVTIQAAVDSILNAGPRGAVLLLDGDFNFAAGTQGVDGSSNVSIRGMGGFGGNWGAGPETNISLPATLATNANVLGNFETVADLGITRSGGLTATNPTLVNASEVRSVYLHCGNLTGSGQGIVQSAAEPLITGNVVTLGSGWTGVFASGLVVGNFIGQCDLGVYLGSNTRAQNNWLFFCKTGIGTHGTDAMVTDNNFQSCGDATHNAIDVFGNRGMIQANMIRRGAAATQYGINVNAGAHQTLVVMNDLLTSAAGSSFNDAGVGTVINFDGSANNWNRL